MKKNSRTLGQDGPACPLSHFDLSPLAASRCIEKVGWALAEYLKKER